MLINTYFLGGLGKVAARVIQAVLQFGLILSEQVDGAMEPVDPIAHPPHKPLLVYDGQCGFCRYWIEHWRWRTGGRVEYVASQELDGQFSEIAPENFRRSVYLLDPRGRAFHGAQAVFRALAYGPGWRWPLWLYRRVPGVAPASERAYEFVARHRTGLGTATRLLWGKQPQQPSYFLTRWLFLRLLGIVYLAAFASLWSQIGGLMGQFGILPARDFLPLVRGQTGVERYWQFPTLAWLGSSDEALGWMCAAGVVCSLFLVLRVAPALMLVLLWALYLSLSIVGQVFLNYQWDMLLLECGFLAIFLAPWQVRPRMESEAPPPLAILWLERWLLFRLMFSSGVVKWSSGDGAWRDLTALHYHFETQPLPTSLGWFLNHLPPLADKGLTLLLLMMELGVPFMIFMPRRPRCWACLMMITFQGLIMASGNYGFFNWLVIALCILLLDDPFLRAFLPSRFSVRLAMDYPHRQRPRVQRWLVAAVTPLVLLISGLVMIGLFRETLHLPRPLERLMAAVQPFRSINSYGLFAVMTKTRPEIIIEGSNDAQTWKAYEFKWKPGDPGRRPVFIAPHQPRLDWQMWFAALGDYKQNPWLLQFMARILEASPPVLALLRENPFREQPPRYLRAVLYEYHFADWNTLNEEGAWWRRELIGEYAPVISLRERNPMLEVERRGERIRRVASVG